MSPPPARGGMFETVTFRAVAPRQEAAMSLYAAIDLHSNNSVLAVIDETDHPLRQCRLPNDLAALLKAIEPFREELSGIAVESTYNWYWLVDGLAEHGYRMHLVNTAAVPQYDGLKCSDKMTTPCSVVSAVAPLTERRPKNLARQRFTSFGPERSPNRQHGCNFLGCEEIAVLNNMAHYSTCVYLDTPKVSSGVFQQDILQLTSRGPTTELRAVKHRIMP